MSDSQERTKLIVVVGVTGNQGGSVALRFLQDPRFRVRGLTRDVGSAKARAMAARGVELAAADLDDVASLERAFAGANAIFSVTQYWEPFFRPDCRARAEQQGISCRRLAYDVEYAQGRNIADAAAAAALDSLDANGFLVSTLSHAARCSGGRFAELYHFDAKADVFPDYVQATHPALARKMSCFQTGCFNTSFQLLPDLYLNKLDGSFLMQLSTHPDKPAPHLDVNADTGPFVYAVHQMPPGRHYMAAGTNCSWSDWIATWGKVTGARTAYRQLTDDEMAAQPPDREFGVEVTKMFTYMSDPGYDGAMDLLWAEDIRKAGIDCPMTTLEEFFAKHDWSETLGDYDAWRERLKRGGY